MKLHRCDAPYCRNETENVFPWQVLGSSSENDGEFCSLACLQAWAYDKEHPRKDAGLISPAEVMPGNVNSEGI